MSRKEAVLSWERWGLGKTHILLEQMLFSLLHKCVWVQVTGEEVTGRQPGAGSREPWRDREGCVSTPSGIWWL